MIVLGFERDRCGWLMPCWYYNLRLSARRVRISLRELIGRLYHVLRDHTNIVRTCRQHDWQEGSDGASASLVYVSQHWRTCGRCGCTERRRYDAGLGRAMEWVKHA